MAQQNQLTLISHTLCPFVQRAVIALEEQGFSYQCINIDLNNKPDWFNKLSPLGKVPVLVINDEVVLFESAVIAEYVNDSGNGKLLPKLAIDKAKARSWIEFASAMLSNIGQLYCATDKALFMAAQTQFNAKLSHLEKNLPEAGYFNGEKFSLVDAAFAPIFRYLELFEILVDLSGLDRYKKVKHWRKLLQQRNSVTEAVSPEYQTLLKEFITDKESYLGEKAKSLQLKMAQV